MKCEKCNKEISEVEMRKSLRCPYCKQFPSFEQESQAHDIVREAMSMNQNKVLDWDKVEKYLGLLEKKYREKGVLFFWHLSIILELKHRYNQGERTTDLYNNIEWWIDEDELYNFRKECTK